MDGRERQLHLRLDAFDLGDAQAGCLPRGVPQQRGLSDARLAADHQNGALTIARLSEHGVETFALACPAEETNPPNGWHLASLKLRNPKAAGPQSIACRRHLSRNASTSSGGALPTLIPRSRSRQATPGVTRSAAGMLTIAPRGRTCRAACW